MVEFSQGAEPATKRSGEPGPNGATGKHILSFSRYQKFVVSMLAFLQFTIILDFMILSPIGATLIPTLKITASQFGLVVSAYAFSAGISGLMAAGFADRFDRKKLLLFFYTGFLFGTFLCGIVSTFEFLMLARIVTGLFGGVVGSVVLAIATDLFPLQMRGRVMGVIQTSFAASQILGIPVGLYLSNKFGWHAPFLMIVGIGVVVGLVIVVKLKPIDSHLKLQHDHNPFQHLTKTIMNRHYALAFLATALLSMGGFMLMPFGSTFTVNNLGISLDHLPMIYLITGVCTIFAGPLVGRASDRFGKYPTFMFGTVVSVSTVLIYTRLGITPLPVVIAVNVVMFVGVFSRMIPSQALITAIPKPSMRGSFNAVSASLQQLSGGIASAVAGLIVAQDATGKIMHFETLGYVVVTTALIVLYLMYRIHRMVPEVHYP